MTAYIIRRLLLVIPTLWAIITINFLIVQLAPGGPVDQAIARMRGIESDRVLERVSGEGRREVQEGGAQGLGTGAEDQVSTYRGARGLDPEVIAEIERRFGFDKPLHVRYFTMLKRYLVLDFGESLFRGRGVVELIIERLPVSISLGAWSTLIIYLVSIPLGIRKAVRHGSRFDIWSSSVVLLFSALPSFLIAIVLVIFFAGGRFLQWFPLRGLVSINWRELGFFMKILDYLWHMVLPVTATVIGGFATLTMLTKNSFLDEIGKQYVMTARAKGVTERRILRGHVFRNAMLLIIAGFPSAFVSIFFTGSILIESIFSLEGLGRLAVQAINQRDYPIIFGDLYMYTILGLVMVLITDLTYTIIDPRIDFESRL